MWLSNVVLEWPIAENGITYRDYAYRVPTCLTKVDLKSDSNSRLDVGLPFSNLSDSDSFLVLNTYSYYGELAFPPFKCISSALYPASHVQVEAVATLDMQLSQTYISTAVVIL